MIILHARMNSAILPPNLAVVPCLCLWNRWRAFQIGDSFRAHTVWFVDFRYFQMTVHRGLCSRLMAVLVSRNVLAVVLQAEVVLAVVVGLVVVVIGRLKGDS